MIFTLIDCNHLKAYSKDCKDFGDLLECSCDSFDHNKVEEAEAEASGCSKVLEKVYRIECSLGSNFVDHSMELQDEEQI